MPLGATQYPTTLDTDVELVVAGNRVTSTLSAGITGSDTSLSLASATNFPSTGGYLDILGEIISYTGKSGNTLTGLTRGLSPSVAASHSSGDTVKLVIAAQTHNVVKDAIKAIETELGTLPKGTYATVKARLDDLLKKTGDTMTGQLTMGDSSTNQHIMLNGTLTFKPGLSTAQADFIFAGGSDKEMVLQHNASSRYVFFIPGGGASGANATGRVGIVTTAPSGRLHVKNAVTSEPIIAAEGASGHTEDMIRAYNFNGDGVFIDSSARLAFGVVGSADSWIYRVAANILKTDGRWIMGTPNSAPTDSHLSNAMSTFYLDQTNNKLKVRVKYSDGTLKTGEITLA